MPPSPYADARKDGGGGHGDDDLLDRISHGDTAAFALFYDRHSNAAYGLACRILGETTAAGEVVERTFLHVWREPNPCGYTGGAAASLLSLVRRIAIDAVRRSTGPVEVARRHGDALPDMPSLQRRAVALAYFDGYRCAEIAEILGVPARQAPDELTRGMRTLGRFLGTETRGQDPRPEDKIKDRHAVRYRDIP
jgi:RNA polymerase sigma-70 factor (ECF subfamily)